MQLVVRHAIPITYPIKTIVFVMDVLSVTALHALQIVFVEHVLQAIPFILEDKVVLHVMSNIVLTATTIIAAKHAVLPINYIKAPV
jgi:hypothetical protein